MRYRSLFFSTLLASATFGPGNLTAAEPMASAAPAKPVQSEPVQSEATQRNAAQDKRAQGTPAQGKSEGGDKALSGMSILGNQEAPKSLVIVPWKSSELGDTLGLAESLDDARQPVDKQVFMRELSYYEIRSSSK